MKTKHCIYLCGIVATAMVFTPKASAQMVVEEVTVAEYVPGKVYYYEESNLDNWYMSVGAGTQTFITEDKGSTGQFTLAMNIAAGKWITPYWGMRMSGMAGSLHYNWKAGAREARHDAGMRYGAFYIDFLWDMTNSVFGYNEHRVFSVIPFAGLGAAYGWHHTGTDNKTWAMPVTGGLKLNFRLAHYVDLFVEGRVQAFPDAFNYISRGSMVETAISAVAGITFKFRQDRFKPYNPHADRLVIAELNNRTNQLRAALNECMTREVDCPPCPEVPAPAPVADKNVCRGTITASVSFAINSSTVSQREMVNLYNVAQWLKEYPNCHVTITGYADRGTGSAEYNLKLSRKRAQAVADVLQASYGIAANRIKIESEGSSKQPYPKENDWNRIVILIGGEK